MNFIKYFVLSIIFLVLSCSNFKGTTDDGISWNYRGGTPTANIFKEILKKDRALAKTVEEVKEKLNNSNSILKYKSIRGDQDLYLSYYDDVIKYTGKITDSLTRIKYSLKINEQRAAYAATLAEKTALKADINFLQNQINQELVQLKISKTLAYVQKESAENGAFDSKPFLKEKKDLAKLLEELRQFGK